MFLLFNSTRFTANLLGLAKQVRYIGKSFFLIRTKIDIDCEKHKLIRERFEEEEMLQRIKNDLMLYVRDLIYSEKEIFLISNYHKDKWDFPRLVAAISAELPVPEVEWSTYSLPNITRDNLKRMAGSSSLKGKSGLLFLYLVFIQTSFFGIICLIVCLLYNLFNQLVL